MDTNANYLISKDDGKLQISYSEYMELMEKYQEAERIQKVRAEVLEHLDCYLNGAPTTREPVADSQPDDMQEAVAGADAQLSEKVSVEFAPENKDQSDDASAASSPRDPADIPSIPPIKKEIEDLFNLQDPSGRLLNVFMQYYSCLNESCQGTVRVTLKDDICSLWNYDKWEEFAFIDVYEGQLRITVDPRYADDLGEYDLCEVARLLAARHKFIAVQVDDLKKPMLEVLTRAFEEIGLTAG